MRSRDECEVPMAADAFVSPLTRVEFCPPRVDSHYLENSIAEDFSPRHRANVNSFSCLWDGGDCTLRADNISGITRVVMHHLIDKLNIYCLLN